MAIIDELSAFRVLHDPKPTDQYGIFDVFPYVGDFLLSFSEQNQANDKQNKLYQKNTYRRVVAGNSQKSL